MSARPIESDSATVDALYGASIAGAYDSDPMGIYTRCYTDIMALLPQRVVTSCADVGVGTGNVLKLIQERYHPARCYGIDPAHSMLELAKQKVPQLIAVHGDFRALQTDQRIRDIDLVMANFILAYASTSELFAAMRGALSDDGVVVITTSTLNSFKELVRIGRHPIFRVIAARYDINSANLDAHMPPVPRDITHLTEQLNLAGLRVVAQRVTHHPIVFHSGAELYRFGRDGGWWVDLYDRLKITDGVARWASASMRVCQFFGLLDRPCTTSMETCTVVAAKA